MLDLSYRAIFNFPAYVQNGDFDKEGNDYRDLNSEEKELLEESRKHVKEVMSVLENLK